MHNIIFQTKDINYKLIKYIGKSLSCGTSNKYYHAKMKKYLQMGGYTNDQIADYIDTLFLNKGPLDQKYLIILYGPPASGKTHARNIICDKLNIDKNKFVDLSIDKFINDNDDYNKDKNEFKNKYEIELSKITDISCDKEYKKYNISDIDEMDINITKLYSPMAKKYNETRSSIASLIFETVLNKIREDAKLSLFIEITGARTAWYTDFIIPQFRQNGYKVYVIYPFVNNIDELVERSACRFTKEIRYVNKSDIIEITKLALQNIRTFINNDDVDGVLIYDNIDKNNRIIFETFGKIPNIDQLII